MNVLYTISYHLAIVIAEPSVATIHCFRIAKALLLCTWVASRNISQAFFILSVKEVLLSMRMVTAINHNFFLYLDSLGDWTKIYKNNGSILHTFLIVSFYSSHLSLYQLSQPRLVETDVRFNSICYSIIRLIIIRDKYKLNDLSSSTLQYIRSINQYMPMYCIYRYNICIFSAECVSVQ